MEPSDLLRRIVAVLEELGLPYLVTGATATIFYGEPRFTADLDIVVQLPPQRIAELVGAFAGEELYLDEESIRQAVTWRGQFTIIQARAARDFVPVAVSSRRRVRPGVRYSS